MKEAMERLADAFVNFADQIRDMAEDVGEQKAGAGIGWPKAGDGEMPEGVNVVPLARAEQGRDGVGDDAVVQIRSGDLRQVINAYRKMTRFAREGKIPTQDERVELHQHIRKVKHLVRPPKRGWH